MCIKESVSEQKFSRYHRLLTRLAGDGLLAASRLPSTSDSVLIAVPAARLLLADDMAMQSDLVKGFDLLARMGRAAGRKTPKMGEPDGHRCSVYHGLVLHLHLAAFNRYYERLPRSDWSMCEDRLPDAVEPVRDIEQYGDVPPPADRVDVVLWQALCLLDQAEALRRDADVELIDSVVHQTIRTAPPDPGGATDRPLHRRQDDEALNVWTCRELCGMHALANLALQRRNRPWARRLEQAALYHLEHTQPDYTTTQPWGVFAFLWPDRTETFAEQQIHGATMQGGSCPGPMASLLLADAAHSLLAFDAAERG